MHHLGDFSPNNGDRATFGEYSAHSLCHSCSTSTIARVDVLTLKKAPALGSAFRLILCSKDYWATDQDIDPPITGPGSSEVIELGSPIETYDPPVRRDPKDKSQQNTSEDATTLVLVLKIVRYQFTPGILSLVWIDGH